MGSNKANVQNIQNISSLNSLDPLRGRPDRAMFVNVSYPDLIYCRLVQVG